MKLANLAGRAVVVLADGSAADLHDWSGGRFGPDPQRVFADWDEFVRWRAGAEPPPSTLRFEASQLGPPVPRPGQLFAIGINYAEHADEAGYPPDASPVTFTKFAGCLAGPTVEVTLPTDTVDWEVELVVVIGRTARRVSRDTAWDHVAGLMVGQDLSERTAQLAGAKPQFSLAKSHRNFGPIGPWLVTPDEVADPDDLAISCAVSGETMQSSRTSRLVYDVAELIVRLSQVCDLSPGDLVFTGTPAGVGNARTPKRFLRPGDVLTSCIEGLGTLTQTFVAAPATGPGQ